MERGARHLIQAAFIIQRRQTSDARIYCYSGHADNVQRITRQPAHVQSQCKRRLQVRGLPGAASSLLLVAGPRACLPSSGQPHPAPNDAWEENNRNEAGVRCPPPHMSPL